MLSFRQSYLIRSDHFAWTVALKALYKAHLASPCASPIHRAHMVAAQAAQFFVFFWLIHWPRELHGENSSNFWYWIGHMHVADGELSCLRWGVPETRHGWASGFSCTYVKADSFNQLGKFDAAFISIHAGGWVESIEHFGLRFPGCQE